MDTTGNSLDNSSRASAPSNKRKSTDVVVPVPPQNEYLPKKRSKYFGVGFHKSSNKWKCTICISGTQLHIGIYETEIEAAKGYDVIAKEMSNKQLNFGNNKQIFILHLISHLF